MRTAGLSQPILVSQLSGAIPLGWAHPAHRPLRHDLPTGSASIRGSAIVLSAVCEQAEVAPATVRRGDVAQKRKWNELSPRTRRLIILGATFEGILKVIALIDIKRQPSDQIRGSKAKRAAAVVLINSAGTVPIAYFVFGRRPQKPSL